MMVVPECRERPYVTERALADSVHARCGERDFHQTMEHRQLRSGSCSVRPPRSYFFIQGFNRWVNTQKTRSDFPIFFGFFHSCNGMCRLTPFKMAVKESLHRFILLTI